MCIRDSLMSIDETFDVGLDTRSGVDDSYELPFKFTGTINKLTFKLGPVSYTHLRAHETVLDLVCRLLLEKKTIQQKKKSALTTPLNTTAQPSPLPLSNKPCYDIYYMYLSL